MHINNGYQEEWMEKWSDRVSKVKDRCSICLYDKDTPSITFDADGICNYCKMYNQMNAEYPSGKEGGKRLEQIVEKIKHAGRKKKYDIAVGVSGGCDSSYMIYMAKELGLRPLAVHFDNTWNSTTAVENIHNVLKGLDVELYTYVVDNEEYDDIYRAFFKAGVPDLEAPTDIGLASTLYLAAEKYGIKYIFEGHSFRTEGVSPLGWLYMDAKYIQNIHKQYGQGKMKTYPNMWFWLQMKWRLVNRIKMIRPLYYIEHNKENTKKFLADNFNWKWYGGHHLENRITNFYHTYFIPRRFGFDQRLNGYSALIRSGQMTREEGLDKIMRPPQTNFDIVDMVKKRLGFSEEEFEEYMTQPIKSFREFKTYKPMFERLRPMFWIMYKMDLVPKSFYVKYTSKNNI